MYYMRDIYPNYFGNDTNTDATPDPAEQESLANLENAENVKPVKNKNKILMWFVVAVVIVALYHIGGKK